MNFADGLTDVGIVGATKWMRTPNYFKLNPIDTHQEDWIIQPFPFEPISFTGPWNVDMRGIKGRYEGTLKTLSFGDTGCCLVEHRDSNTTFGMEGDSGALVWMSSDSQLWYPLGIFTAFKQQGSSGLVVPLPSIATLVGSSKLEFIPPPGYRLPIVSSSSTVASSSSPVASSSAVAGGSDTHSTRKGKHKRPRTKW